MSDLIDGKLTVVALDPGGTTGIATYDADIVTNTENQIEYYNEKFNVLEMGPYDHHFALYNFLQYLRTQNTRVVCEAFHNRGMNKDLIALQYIGIIRLFTQETMGMPTYGLRQVLWMQEPSIVNSKQNSFWNDSKLKKLGRYTPGMKHGNDAMAHLLHHLSFTMKREDILLQLKA